VTDPDRRREVAVACRILADAGLGDSIYGHVAARVTGHPDQFWVKPPGLGLAETAAESLLRMSLGGDVLKGQAPPHREWPIHAAIFASRSDVHAVVHTHPKFGITLPLSGQRLLPVNQDGALFHDGVPEFTAFAHLVDTIEDGQMVAQSLGMSRALFLLNHGVVVVGEDVAAATVGALMLERACEIQLLAPSGRPAPLADAITVARQRLQGARRVFDHHARRLGLS